MIKLMNSDKAIYIAETSVKSVEYNDSTKVISIAYFNNIPSTNIIFTTDADYQQAAMNCCLAEILRQAAIDNGGNHT